MSPVKRAMTAKQFRELLEASGLSQAELARRIGVHKQTVSRWSKGHTPIDPFKSAAIREALQAK